LQLVVLAPFGFEAELRLPLTELQTRLRRQAKLGVFTIPGQKTGFLPENKEFC